MELYKKIKAEQPHLLELELARVRKIWLWQKTT